MDPRCRSWLESFNWQLDFHEDGRPKNRGDHDFDWKWLDSYERRGTARGFVGQLARKAVEFASRLGAVHRPAQQINRQWVNEKAGFLWEARQLLEDDLSKVTFDNALLLNVVGHRRFYLPRVEHDELLTILHVDRFAKNGLPQEYLGIPLQQFTARVNCRLPAPELTIVATGAGIGLLNRYRQYFMRRGSLDVSPRPGEVVMDCGACIGEVSMVFASMVGDTGEVHTFDPVPLHSRFIEHQSSLNPSLSRSLRINRLAVGDRPFTSQGSRADSPAIAPGGCAVDSFETTSLDAYCSQNAVSRVDYVKMDIEGAEIAALKGACGIVKAFRPRLAISAYHRPEDLWEIPILVKELGTSYRLFFGHHTPMCWESVYYAV